MLRSQQCPGSIGKRVPSHPETGAGAVCGKCVCSVCRCSVAGSVRVCRCGKWCGAVVVGRRGDSAGVERFDPSSEAQLAQAAQWRVRRHLLCDTCAPFFVDDKITTGHRPCVAAHNSHN